MSPLAVLVVDDEESVRTFLAEFLGGGLPGALGSDGCAGAGDARRAARSTRCCWTW